MGEAAAAAASPQRDTDIVVPQVFVEGNYLGNADVIETMNERGELRNILKPFKSISVTVDCKKCGGFRMLPCPVCNGSKKSVHREEKEEEGVHLSQCSERNLFFLS